MEGFRGKYLVTGTAGTGKTTLEKLLAQRGFETNDIDYGFAGWYDRATMQPTSYNPDGGAEWLGLNTFRLHLPLVKEHIAKQRDIPLIMLGHTGDVYDQRALFDGVFVLEYPNDDLLRHRLLTRDGNPYGKHPDELAKELAYYGAFQDKFRAAGAVMIDCSLPSERIATIISERIAADSIE